MKIETNQFLEVQLEALHGQLRRKIPERAEIYFRHLKPLLKILSEQEKLSILSDPIEFVSHEFLFRGLSENQARSLITEGKMNPQDGQYGSIAVFETDSPYSALTFTKGNLSALVVIDRKKILTKDEKIYNTGSDEYKHWMNENLPPGERNMQNLVDMQNQIDVETVAVSGHKWHILELRLPQPLSEVKNFIIQLNDELLILDPSIPEELEKLKLLYLM